MAVSSALRLREDENKDRPKIEMDYSRSQMSTIEDQVGYNDYQHPPDLKICESYGKSMVIGIRQPLKKAKQEDICPANVKSCVRVHSHSPKVVKKHPICFKDKDIIYLGAGYVLYFYFLRCIIGMSLIMILSQLYTTYDYIKGTACTVENNCRGNILIWLSVANYGVANSSTHKILLMVLMVLLSVSNLFMIKVGKKVDRKIDAEEDSPEDYTIMVEGLPKLESEAKIKENLDKIILSQKRKIKNVLSKFIPQNRVAPNRQGSQKEFIEKVSKAYKLKDFSVIVDRLVQYRKLRAKHRIIVKILKKKLEENLAHQHMKEVLSINKKIEGCKKMLKQLKYCLNTKQYSTSIAFVSFKYKAERDDFISRYEPSILQRLFCFKKGIKYKDKKLTVRKAPEPGDIVWDNLGISTKEKNVRKVATLSASFVVIFICFSVVMLLKNWQFRISKNINGQEQSPDLLSSENLPLYALSFGISVVITIINALLKLILRLFCDLEAHSSMTDFHSSFIFKLVFTQFINSCLVLLLSHLILSPSIDAIWQPGGLIYDVVFVIISKTFIVATSNLLNIELFIKKVQKRFFLKNYDRKNLLQYEANELFTGPEVDISSSISDSIEFYYASLFFCPLFPLNSLFLLFCSTFFLFSEKFLFARVYKRPDEIDSDVSIKGIYLLGYGPVLLMVSNIVFNELLERNTNAADLILIIIGAVSCSIQYFYGQKISILETNKDTETALMGKDSERLKHDNNQPYSNVRHNFNNEYDRANPVTSEDKTREYLSWLLENEFAISNKVFEFLTAENGLNKDVIGELFLDNFESEEGNSSTVKRKSVKKLSKNEINLQLNMLFDNDAAPKAHGSGILRDYMDSDSDDEDDKCLMDEYNVFLRKKSIPIPPKTYRSNTMNNGSKSYRRRASRFGKLNMSNF